MLKIGVNTPLLKESIAEIGIYDTLKWVAEIGYHYIEVSQVPINPETVKEFRRAEDDFGIQVCSISVDAEPEPQTPDGARKMNVRDDLEAIAEACRILGCKHCRTFSAGTDDFATEENVRKYAKKMDEAAERLATVGLDYSYHPHNIGREDGDADYEGRSEDAEVRDVSLLDSGRRPGFRTTDP